MNCDFKIQKKYPSKFLAINPNHIQTKHPKRFIIQLANIEINMTNTLHSSSKKSHV